MTKLTVTLPDGTTRELPDGFPTTQGELDQIIQNRLGPKNQRISELEGQVKTLTGERDTLTSQVTEKDQKINQLESSVTEKDRALLVTQVSHAKGVPAKWLTGDTQEALEQSADEWLADARGVGGGGQQNPPADPPADPPPGGGAGTGQEAGGYVGSAGTGDETPARPSFEEAKKRAYERAKNQQKGVLA